MHVWRECVSFLFGFLLPVVNLWIEGELKRYSKVRSWFCLCAFLLRSPASLYLLVFFLMCNFCLSKELFLFSDLTDVWGCRVGRCVCRSVLIIGIINYDFTAYDFPTLTPFDAHRAVCEVFFDVGKWSLMRVAAWEFCIIMFCY